MGLRPYTDMELGDDEALDGAIATPTGTNVSQYPWGLRLSLTEAELTKLGLTEDPEVGDMLHFAAFAKVTSYSSGDNGQGPQRRVELQIVMISCLENENLEMGDADDT